MDRIPIFPLDVVLFPGEPFGLHVFEERYLLMTEEVLQEGLPIGIVMARPDQPEGRVEYEPMRVGTSAQVLAAERMGDRYLLQTVGRRRFRIVNLYSDKPYQEADVEWLDEEEGEHDEALRLVDQVAHRIEALGGAITRAPREPDPVMFSHAVAAALRFDLPTKQGLLEAGDAQTRLAAEALLLREAEQR